MSLEAMVRIGSRSMSLLASLAALLLLVSGMLLPHASAAYPGRDGKIAFTRANQIYTINADGTAVKKLTSSGKNYRPRYSPSGTEIAYVHETADGYRDIWLMRADGSNKRAVSHLGNVTGPSWSPSGRGLAFGGGTQGLLLQTVTRSPSGVWGSPSPVWAYACDGAVELSNLPVTGAVAWGQGNRVAFATPNSCGSPDWGMAVVDLDTFTPTVQVVDEIGGSCCGFGRFEDPAWSPDGARLAYSVLDRWSLDDESRPLPDIIRFYDSANQPARPYDKQPAFSPTDTRMAATNTSSGTSRIMIFNSTSGTGRRFLTNGYQADWQPRP